MDRNKIWDSILKADARRQAIGDIRSKKKQISKLPTVCGSCDLWMTSQCKKEKTIKVSCNMSICSDFKQQKWVGDLISKLKGEIADLEVSLNSGQSAFHSGC